MEKIKKYERDTKEKKTQNEYRIRSGSDKCDK